MADENGGAAFIRINNREIYERLVKVSDKVDSVARAVDAAREETVRAADIAKDELVDMKKRVRALELRFYGILAGLIGAVGSFALIVFQGRGV